MGKRGEGGQWGWGGVGIKQLFLIWPGVNNNKNAINKYIQKKISGFLKKVHMFTK